ncbi:SWIM zinc finger family protein [Corynebacterium sp. 335C]
MSDDNVIWADFAARRRRRDEAAGSADASDAGEGTGAGADPGAGAAGRDADADGPDHGSRDDASRSGGPADRGRGGASGSRGRRPAPGTVPPPTHPTSRPLTGAEAWGGIRRPAPGPGRPGGQAGLPGRPGLPGIPGLPGGVAAPGGRGASAGAGSAAAARGRAIAGSSSRTGGRTRDPRDDRARGWASRRLLKELLDGVTDGRAARGADYHRDGHVVDVQLGAGTVVAQVAGSQLEPFTVVLQLPARRGGRRDALLDALLGAPEGMGPALAGRDAPDFADELLIDPDERIHASCDCPDATAPCKHIVAVALELAARIDASPEDLLALRGITQEELQDRLARRGADAAIRASRPVQPVPADGDVPALDFWGASRARPPRPEISAEPALRDTETGLLHDALDVVSHGPADELRGYSQLEELYERLMGQWSADGPPDDDGDGDGDGG